MRTVGATAFVTAAILSIALGGCGLARQAELDERQAAAEKALAAEQAACSAKYPDPAKRPVAPRMQCVAAALESFDAATGPNPFIDLRRALRARMLVTAERYDAGRTSAAEFEAEMADTIAEFNTRAQQRSNASAMVAAAQYQAYASNRSRSCQAWGTTVTCY